MNQPSKPNQEIFYRHFKNLRKTIRETKTLNTSCLRKSSNPDWASQPLKEKKKKIADLCDIQSVCQSIGEISATTLPLIKNFGPALNKLPKTFQRIRQYDISDAETPFGFEKNNRFVSGRFKSTLLYSGQIEPGTQSEVMTVTQKGCPATVIIAEENEEETSDTQNSSTS